MYDNYFQDDAEFMPGDYAITYRNIRLYKENKDFQVFKIIGNGSKKRTINFNKEIQEAFIYYYNIWDDYHYFGLAHGGGSIKELPWYLDFIKHFERIFNEIESYRYEKRLMR